MKLCASAGLQCGKNMEEPKISKRPCPDYEAQGIRAYQGILVQTPMFLKQIQLGSRVVPLEPGGATSIKNILYKCIWQKASPSERIQTNRVPILIQQDGFSGLSQVLHPSFQVRKSWEVFGVRPLAHFVHSLFDWSKVYPATNSQSNLCTCTIHFSGCF